jgi:phosphatidylserine decarboxylase
MRYDTPESVAEIPAFISMYRVNLAEVEKPLMEYKTFNEFFARSLKKGCRPIADADLVSPADCRIVVFDHWTHGSRLWLKGSNFSVEELIGPDLKHLADRFKHCAVAVFRLAPNDYHRWHMPFAAVHGARHAIQGEYYSVSPRAVNNCNVLSQNKREVCVFTDELFGTSLMIAVGAAGVGGINIDATDGQRLEKGAEHGYFSYGGSTLVMLFESNTVQFDEDLLVNSRQPIETLIKMGEGIGRSIRQKKSVHSCY